MDLFIIFSVSSRFGLKILVMVLISCLSIYLYLHLLGSVRVYPFLLYTAGTRAWIQPWMGHGKGKSAKIKKYMNRKNQIGTVQWKILRCLRKQKQEWESKINTR